MADHKTRDVEFQKALESLYGWVDLPALLKTLDFDRMVVSVPVRKDTTLGDQRVSAERLRRDPFDRSQGSNQLAGLARDRSLAVGRGDRLAEVVAMFH